MFLLHPVMPPVLLASIVILFSGCLQEEVSESGEGGFVDDGNNGGFVDNGNNGNNGNNGGSGGDGDMQSSCGDGVVDQDSGEACDSDQLQGASCASLGLGEGTLLCTAQCVFDVSGCSEPDAQSVCGDGVLAEDEGCEQGLIEAACADFDNFDGGEITCASDCTLDTSGCTLCGDGAVQGQEECDGSDLSDATCQSLNPDTPNGSVRCGNDCLFDTSGCVEFSDRDNDLVVDGDDPEPDNFKVCGDADNDGCDDCSLLGRSAPDEDGYDPNGDGRCELPLDYDCINGEYADQDPHRLDACVMLTHVNRDRAHFDDESDDAAPVEWSEEIWEVAIAHSMDMCNRGYFDHTNPDGDGPGDRISAAGLNFPVAENIAVNFDAGAAEYAFMNEPTCVGHRGNILDPRMIQMGIGYYECDRPTSQYQWGEHHHITQNFRMNFAIDPSAYCQRAANHCEVPPDPPTTATCPDQLIEWGWCPSPSPSLLRQWSCPDD